MGAKSGSLHVLGVSLFRRLAGWYPERFRRLYAAEILDVLQQGLEEAGASALPAFIIQESGALLVSVAREHWHTRRVRKEVRMAGEDQLYGEIRTVFLQRRLRRAGRVLLLLAALVVLFFGALYAYARVQIAQAKEMGVFSTLEEAVYSQTGDEFRGARVIRVNFNHAGPCFPDGKQSYIWCVSSTVYFDRNPTGYQHSKFSGGYTSYYHLQEGWVHVSELIPGLTGQLMELFRIEGLVH